MINRKKFIQRCLIGLGGVFVAPLALVKGVKAVPVKKPPDKLTSKMIRECRLKTKGMEGTGDYVWFRENGFWGYGTIGSKDYVEAQRILNLRRSRALSLLLENEVKFKRDSEALEARLKN